MKISLKEFKRAVAEIIFTSVFYEETGSSFTWPTYSAVEEDGRIHVRLLDIGDFVISIESK